MTAWSGKQRRLYTGRAATVDSNDIEHNRTRLNNRLMVEAPCLSYSTATKPSVACACVSRLSEFERCVSCFSITKYVQLTHIVTRTFLDLYSGMFRFTFFFITSWVSDDSTSGPTTSTTLDAKRSSATPRYLILPPIVKEQKQMCAEVHYVAHQDRVSQTQVRKISRYLDMQNEEKPECNYRYCF